MEDFAAEPVAITNPLRFPDHPIGYLTPTNTTRDHLLSFWGVGTSFAGEYYDTGVKSIRA